MGLSCCEQRCLYEFFAEIRPGDRPILCVLHQIGGHQTNIGILIGKNSNYAGTSPNLTVQPLNYVRGRDFPGIREIVKGKRVFQAGNGLGRPFPIGIKQIVGPIPGQLCGRHQPDLLQNSGKSLLIFLRNMGQNISREMHLTMLPGSSREEFSDCGSQSCVGI